MRLTRPLLALVVTFLVAGVVLLVVGQRADDYGGFAYAPLEDADLSDRYGGTPWQTTAGWALLWVSSVVAAGLVGAALVRRRTGRD